MELNISGPSRVRHGRVMKLIDAYLEKRAENSKYATDPDAYARLDQIANDLGLRHDTACDSLAILVRNGKVRIYPDGTKCGKLYGSWKLPEIDRADFIRETLLHI